jgi:Xaa-Pro aminopeptidase
MTDVVIYGDTIRSAELRHELALAVPDPFLYLEADGRRHAVAPSMEHPRIAVVDGNVELHAFEEFGIDELLASDLERRVAQLEVLARACQALGLQSAVVPGAFPLELADRLRACGIALQPDQPLFDARRRVKSEAELAGIRRAQAAAEEGMRAAARLLRGAEPGSGGLIVGGEPLTCERLKDAIRDGVAGSGAAPGDDFIVSHGAQSAVGHESGSGWIQPSEPVIIDLWPRDPESACFADMTRTFVVGEAPEELRSYHELTRESLERARRAVHAGVAGREVYGISCEPYERQGLPTQRTKAPRKVLEEGYYHSLGHGVGLEVHEPPTLGRAPDLLVAGDVITLEPGCYRPGFGGCRLEDLVLVTEDGCDLLTDFPYELQP